MEANENFNSPNYFKLLVSQSHNDGENLSLPPIMNPLLTFINSDECQHIVCFDGYYYIMTRSNDKRTYYRCRNTLCSGRGVSIGGSFTCIKFHKPGCTPQALTCSNSFLDSSTTENESHLQQNNCDNTMDFSEIESKPDLNMLANNNVIKYIENLKDYAKDLRLPSHIDINDNSWQPVIVLDSISISKYSKPKTHPIATGSTIYPNSTSLPYHDFENKHPLIESYARSINSSISDVKNPDIQFVRSNRGKKVLCYQNRQYILIRYNVDGTTAYYRCRNQPCTGKGILKGNTIFEITIDHDEGCRPYHGMVNGSTHVKYVRSESREMRDVLYHDDRQYVREAGLNTPTDGDTIYSPADGPHHYRCRNAECPARGILDGDTFRPTLEHVTGCHVASQANGEMDEHRPSLPITFVRSNKGRDILCFDGRHYIQQRQNFTGSIRYYKCRNQFCPARAILKGTKFTLTIEHYPLCVKVEGMADGSYGQDSTQTLKPRVDEGPEIDITKMLEEMGELPQPSTNIKFIRSNKGRAVLCYENHQYTQHHRNYKGHTFYYKCRNKDCTARGILKGKTFIPTKEHDEECVDPNMRSNCKTVMGYSQGHVFKDEDLHLGIPSMAPAQVPQGNNGLLCFTLSPDGEIMPRYEGITYQQSNVCGNKIYYHCQDPECNGRGVFSFRPIKSHSRDCREVQFASQEEAAAASLNNSNMVPVLGITTDGTTPDPSNFQTIATSDPTINKSNMFASILCGTDYLTGSTEGLDLVGVDLLNSPTTAKHSHPHLHQQPSTWQGRGQPSLSSGSTLPTTPVNDTVITYVASSNGKPMAYYQGYLYINDRTYNNNMYYRCHRAPQCPGRGKIMYNNDDNGGGPGDGGGNTFLITQMHNHGVDVNKFMGLETRNKLKEAVLSNPCQPLKLTYDQVMHARKLEVRNIEMYPYALPRYKTVQRSMGKLLSKIRLAFPNYREMFYN